MIKKLLLFLILLSYLPVFSQVGIGTTTPNAKLEIKATSLTTPTNTDGVLIPKMNDFPTTNPTILQDGMLVFITGNGTPNKGFYYWDQPTTTWKPLGGNSGVKKINDLLDGKSSSGGSSVFLGVQSGFFDDGTDNRNTGVGFQSIRATTTGIYNSGIGYRSLFNNTTGNFNTGLGGNALFSNTTGVQNTAIGINALFQNSTGINNTANGVNAMRYSTVGSYNVADGSRSLFSLTVGNRNTVSGFEAMFTSTGAYRNTSSGFRSLYSNVTGSYNTAVGYEAGYSNTGASNVFLGYQAGYFSNGNNKLFIENRNANANNALIYGEFGADNTASGNILRTNSQFQIGNPTLTGYAFPTVDGTANQVLATDGNGTMNWTDANTLINPHKINDLLDGKSDNDGTQNGSSVFLGINAGLNDDSTDNKNVGVGFKSLKSNTSGFSNTAVGSQSLFYNTTSNFNTAIGYISLFSNTSGFLNTAVGAQSLSYNTSGVANTALGMNSLMNNLSGSYNTAIGSSALFNNMTGSYNTAIGLSTLHQNSTGTFNTAIGLSTLYRNFIGSFNTTLGTYALFNNISGNYNTAIGYNACFNGSSYSNATALGNGTNISASNQIRLGNNIVTSIGGFANWTNVSDARFKKNIKENVKGLDFILRLRPVTYHLDLDKIDNYLKIPDSLRYGKDNALRKYRKLKEKEIQTGFIAQEVEQAAKELGYDFSGIDKPKNENDYYGLRYAEFVVPLVKAVQEQNKVIEDLKQQNNRKDEIIRKLQQGINLQNERINKLFKLINK